MDLYWLYEIPLWLDMLLFLLVLLVPMEVGIRMGLRRNRSISGGEEVARRDVILSALLALLGLMLAFTYAFSMSRADLRKQTLIAEVNAIGTAFHRADLLPEPGRTELRQRLLDYARTRIVTPEMAHNREQLQQVLERSLLAQSKLWPATRSAVQQAGDVSEPQKVSLVAAINEVLDAHTLRMAVVYDRLPSAVLALLLLIAATSMALAAYKAGLCGETRRWSMGAFAVILAALIFLILDFDIVLRGFVQVDQESLHLLVLEMEAE